MSPPADPDQAALWAQAGLLADPSLLDRLFQRLARAEAALGSAAPSPALSDPAPQSCPLRPDRPRRHPGAEQILAAAPRCRGAQIAVPAVLSGAEER